VGACPQPASPLKDVGTDATCASHVHVWPIRTRDQYLQAREIVDKLAVKGEDELTEAECDQLEIFSILMEKYEDEYFPIDRTALSPTEFLALLVKESEMSASDLGRLLGDRSLGYKILNGQRKLSKAHIKILSEYFRVNAGAFL
jgi:HTH-type transcriptional regulator/antitoxin HigA